MTDEPFLSRWSRLKRKAVEPTPAHPQNVDGQEKSPSPLVGEGFGVRGTAQPSGWDSKFPAGQGRRHPHPNPSPVEGEGLQASASEISEPDAEAERPDKPLADDPLANLPRIEDLTGESDFTPFLKPGVPDDLHRQALRKLWTSDPIYANDDGLKDYAGDYTGLFNLTEPVKTLYRVGQGFLDAVEEGEAAAPPADPAASEATEEVDKLSHPETDSDQDLTK